MGYDFYHRENDELWNSEEVRALLAGKPPPKSEEEKKQTRKARNQRFYQKRMGERRALEAELRPKAESGEISWEEFERRLAELKPIGMYRALAENAAFKRKLADAERKLAEAEVGGNAAEVEHRRAQLQQLLKYQDTVGSQFEEFSTSIFQMFKRPCPEDDDGDPLPEPERDSSGTPVKDRNGREQPLLVYNNGGGEPTTRPRQRIPLPTWSRPTTEHFLQILALCLPMSEWPGDPLEHRAVSRVHRILSSGDQMLKAHNVLGNYVDATERAEVLKAFNTALETIRIDTEDDYIKADLIQQWDEVKTAVLQEFQPKYAEQPPIVFLRVMEEMSQVVDSDSDDDE